MNYKKADNLWGYFFVGPQVLGMLCFSLFPLIFAFIISFMKWDGFGTKEFIGLGNYIAEFKGEKFSQAMINTLYYTSLVVPGGIIVSLIIALGLNKVRGKLVYRVFYFAPSVTSAIAVSIVFTWLYNADFGLINTYLRMWFGIEGPGWLTDKIFVIPSIAILGIWLGLGFNMVIFLAGLQGISSTYYEASEIDGANKLQQFWHITVPLLSPTTFFVTIISIINSFQVFDQAFQMTGGGPARASYTMVFHIYDSAFVQFTFGRSTAVAVILFIIILILTLIQMLISRRWVHYGG